MTKRLMKCANCLGTDVRKDAWASWNSETDEWELSAVFDENWCEECEMSCDIVQDELEDPAPAVPVIIDHDQDEVVHGANLSKAP